MLEHLFPGLRLITFDLDDTLWPCHGTIMRAEDALFEWLQSRAPRLTEIHSVSSMREHRRELAHAKPHLTHDLNLLRTRHLEVLLEESGDDISLAVTATEYFQEHRNRVEPFDDVTEVLQQLGRQYMLISVTNGTSEIDKTPLAGLFHHSLTAAQVGHAKPHPAMLQEALMLAGVKPEESLHIGDDPRRDVEPAQALGMQAVRVVRVNTKFSCGVEEEVETPGVLHISSLYELLNAKPG